jgi:hypothetical protein
LWESDWFCSASFAASLANLSAISASLANSANCQCGERETVEHYILHCDQYEEAREKLIHDIILLSGSMHQITNKL